MERRLCLSPMRTLKRFFATPRLQGTDNTRFSCAQGTTAWSFVARQGRFNVEGYLGFEPIARSLNSELLREAHSLTHSQVQSFLAGIGHLKGYEVYVPVMCQNMMLERWIGR